MSAPATPISVTTAVVSSIELDSQSVTKRSVVTEILDEDDKTYVVSDSEPDDSDEYEMTGARSEDDSEVESDASGVSGVLISEDIVKNVVLIDESSIALAEEQPSAEFTNFLLKHEIPRKVFHSFHGWVTVYLYTCGFSQHQIAVPLWGLFIGTFLFELVRLNVPKVNDSVLPWVRLFIRESETHSWNGIVFYLAGVSLVLTFAAKDIAVVSIMLLSWADTAASTFGRAFGKYTPKVAPGKSLAGSLASAVVGVLVCYFFYGYMVPHYDVNSPGDLAWTPKSSIIDIHVYALATGIIASVSEAFAVANIDDNFTLPVFSAISLSGLTWACHS